MCPSIAATKQYRDDRVHGLGKLHALDVGRIEREHQQVAADRHGGAAEHDDPVDQLLAGVEAIGRRMVVADDAATALEPFDIDLVRDVAGDPHQEDAEHADREREAEIIVRVLRPLEPSRERAFAISGINNGLPKVMLSPEIARMMKQVAVIQWTNRSKPLKAHDAPTGKAALELLRVPVRRAAVSEGRQLRLTRQNGQVHLLRRRPEADAFDGRVREIRLQRLPSKLRLCAEMCSTKSLLAGDGDNHRAIYKERVTRRATAPRMGWQPRIARRSRT